MDRIILEKIASNGATAVNDERREQQRLQALMQGHGGTRGISVTYTAERNRDGTFSNFGHVLILADNEKAAKRYREAKAAGEAESHKWAQLHGPPPSTY